VTTAAAVSTAPATSPTNASPGLADSFKAALSDTPNATQVTVRVSPSDASVFKHGRHLGKGVVTLDLAPRTRTTLVAQLDGYTPRTVVLDGSNTSVNIVLNRAQAPAVVKREVAATGKPPPGSRDAPDNPY
jgi:hypothetical protein